MRLPDRPTSIRRTAEPLGELGFLDAIRGIGVHDHLCFIYETPDEQFAAIVPFVRFGLERGERCVYITDQTAAATILGVLDDAGIGVDAVLERGVLSVVTKREAYLREGHFDPDAMIRFLAEAVDEATTAGFSALRVTGEMTWALGGERGAGRLLEYEAKLNRFFPTAPVVGLCQYDRRFFPASVLKGVIETHPLVVFGRTVCRNLYYVPCDEFLAPRSPEQEVQRLLDNIVERERAELALRTSEARLSEAQRIAHVGHWDWDIEGGRLAWSDEVYRIFGVTPQSFGATYEAFLERVHPEDRRLVTDGVDAALHDGKAYSVDHRIMRPGGDVGVVHERAEVTFGAGGRPLRMLGTVEDITERRGLEQRLRRAARALRTISRCNQAIVHAADEGTLLNEACRILVAEGGYRLAWVGLAEEDDARTVRAVARAGEGSDYVDDVRITWADDERGQGPTGTAIRSGEPSVARFIATDPAYAPWRAAALARGYASSIALPLRIEGRTIGAFNAYSGEADAFDAEETELLAELAADLAYGIATLRTAVRARASAEALRQSEEQMRQVQKIEAVGRLAGGIAHDFNNVLGVIIAQAELLRKELDRGAQGRVNEIQAAAERAAGLTRQLLTFSRKQVLQPEVLNVASVLRDTQKMLKRLIGEDIELVSVLDPETGRVKADPVQIEQVIVNLAVNARDAMPDGGRLTIETANVDVDDAYVRHHAVVAPGRYVLLTISDTGCGMDAETQGHVFEPFFTTKEEGKGTGLGLATVYGIVKQTGGHIWVDSVVGRGTTFNVYLPRVDEPLALHEAADAPPVGGSETILLVEDEALLRELTRDLLEAHGYEVLSAGTGAEAVAISERYRGRIHLLLTDVVMPGVHGRELARQVQAHRPDVKVLYMTGYTDDAIARHGVLDPGNLTLPKPFTSASLARRVREALE